MTYLQKTKLLSLFGYIAFYYNKNTCSKEEGISAERKCNVLIKEINNYLNTEENPECVKVAQGLIYSDLMPKSAQVEIVRELILPFYSNPNTFVVTDENNRTLQVIADAEIWTKIRERYHIDQVTFVHSKNPFGGMLKKCYTIGDVLHLPLRNGSVVQILGQGISQGNVDPLAVLDILSHPNFQTKSEIAFINPENIQAVNPNCTELVLIQDSQKKLRILTDPRQDILKLISWQFGRTASYRIHPEIENMIKQKLPVQYQEPEWKIFHGQTECAALMLKRVQNFESKFDPKTHRHHFLHKDWQFSPNTSEFYLYFDKEIKAYLYNFTYADYHNSDYFNREYEIYGSIFKSKGLRKQEDATTDIPYMAEFVHLARIKAGDHFNSLNREEVFKENKSILVMSPEELDLVLGCVKDCLIPRLDPDRWPIGSSGLIPMILVTNLLPPGSYTSEEVDRMMTESTCSNLKTPIF